MVITVCSSGWPRSLESCSLVVRPQPFDIVAKRIKSLNRSDTEYRPRATFSDDGFLYEAEYRMLQEL